MISIFTRLFMSLVILGLAAAAQAHGPTPQRVDETITIAASPEEVWKYVGDFSRIAEWHPKVKSSKVSGGNATGAERELILVDDIKLMEGLDEYDADNKALGYRLNKENVDLFPVSFYTAHISVRPADGGSEVEWKGRFYRADTGNFPPDDKNDAAAIAAITDFFQTGLQGLKSKIEEKK
ncbi:MAG: SRPBCC family protein [Hyphomicrobiaceae bacterium]